MFKLKEIIRLISIRRIFGTFQTLQIRCGLCLVFIERFLISVSIYRDGYFAFKTVSV